MLKMKTGKQRLFEVMGMLDNSFKPSIKENNGSNVSNIVLGDIIKLIFNPQELQVFQQAMQTDAKNFNNAVEFDSFAFHENIELKVQIQRVLQSKGVQVNEQTIDFLTAETWNYLI